jgi:hypothetical protein
VTRALGLVVVLAALAFAGAGCGDNSSQCPNGDCADASPFPDGMPDSSTPTDDFTAFVHDLINNHTNPTEDPVPFASFATLVDNDLDDNDYSEYADLF